MIKRVDAFITTNANKIHRHIYSDFCLSTRNANLVEIFVKGLEAKKEVLFKVALENCPDAILAIESFTDTLEIRC